MQALRSLRSNLDAFLGQITELMLELGQNPAGMPLLQGSPDRDLLFTVTTVTAVGWRRGKADVGYALSKSSPSAAVVCALHKFLGMTVLLLEPDGQPTVSVQGMLGGAPRMLTTLCYDYVLLPACLVSQQRLLQVALLYARHEQSFGQQMHWSACSCLHKASVQQGGSLQLQQLAAYDCI